jgi:hypothetical protein
MIYEIYAIRDTKANAYLKPLFVPNEAMVTRSIKNILDDPDHDLAKNPEDYQLYHLGTYDDVLGTINGVPAVHVLNVIQLGEKSK